MATFEATLGRQRMLYQKATAMFKATQDISRQFRHRQNK
jgi:hypothetical protein